MDWLQFLDKQGWPAVTTFLVVLGVIYTTRAVWRDFVLPIRDQLVLRGVKSFDKFDSEVCRLRDLRDMVEGLHVQVERIINQCTRLEEHLMGPYRPSSRTDRPAPLRPKEHQHPPVTSVEQKPPSSTTPK